MSYKNVEVISQDTHQKTWFNRYKFKLGTTLAATSLALAGTSANAFLAAADVATATEGAGGEAVLKSVGIWVVTIAVGIAVVLKVVSLVKK